MDKGSGDAAIACIKCCRRGASACGSCAGVPVTRSWRAGRLSLVERRWGRGSFRLGRRLSIRSYPVTGDPAITPTLSNVFRQSFLLLFLLDNCPQPEECPPAQVVHILAGFSQGSGDVSIIPLLDVRPENHLLLGWAL